MQQFKLLKALYQQRSFGYQYFNDIQNSHYSDMQNFDLPKTLPGLQDYIQDCTLCHLSKGRKNIVFGEGNPNADIMFVGEGPGEMEDNSGRPFVGRAGQLLDKIIENVLMLQRQDVYIANIVKCRPPGNRAPIEEEANQCKPFLMKQIEVVQPKIIIALGASSYCYLTGNLDARITRVRGEMIDFGIAKLMPTFHPSYLLRNPSAKKEVMLDMLKVKAML
ncbi:MAG: uracil-DNA glycosylase [Epsilonproteobacteria bacterium]|nr:uracil-DNA glycosylase [Campylobacterota bacterium]